MAQLEVQRQELAQSFPAATWENRVSSQTALTDPTAKAAFRLIRLQEQWAKVNFYVQAVEDVLAVLQTERRRLVELKYFKGNSQFEIENQLSMSQSTLYRLEKEILMVFAHRLGI